MRILVIQVLRPVMPIPVPRNGLGALRGIAARAAILLAAMLPVYHWSASDCAAQGIHGAATGGLAFRDSRDMTARVLGGFVGFDFEKFGLRVEGVETFSYLHLTINATYAVSVRRTYRIVLLGGVGSAIKLYDSFTEVRGGIFARFGDGSVLKVSLGVDMYKLLAPDVLTTFFPLTISVQVGG